MIKIFSIIDQKIDNTILPIYLDDKVFCFCKDISEADFILTPEPESLCYHSEKLAINNKKYHAPYKALGKIELHDFFKSMGFDVIPTVRVKSQLDIENLSYEKLFLKPNVFSGGFLGVPSAPSLYKPITKEQAISYLPEHNTGDGLVVQPYLTNDSLDADLVMVPGVVNSYGKIHFQKCLEVIHRLGEGIVHSVRGNLESDIKDYVQELTSKYINHYNVKNTVFLMQFIKLDGKFLPMDFQYRLSYFERFMIIRAYPDYIRDLHKYAFDQIDNVPFDPTRMQILDLIDIPEDKDSNFVKDLMQEMNVFILSQVKIRKDRKRLFYFIGSDKDTIMNNINLFKERLCS